MAGIIGKKVGMTRMFAEDGKTLPVTILKCEPNKVAQVKTSEKDGYTALVLGMDELKNPRKTKKFKKLKEFKCAEDALEKFQIGANLTVEEFTLDELVKVTSTSKGKGFQGTIKRHNFSRGPESHGSHHHREPGSVGACAKPGRVHKGKKLAGRMGGEQVSLNKIKIVHVDKDNNLIALKGSIPGPNGGTVFISKY